ncbi:formyltransferase family protein [Bradyrhizobium sp.]|uniref:phosphoribosylglycinamide formyltransferase n=1 Tax=Bradyrhizobium sp. TaxID=376 RepID=UPI000A83721D|nr:formyltransferase family protein [Bradyrhizobium sp.]
MRLSWAVSGRGMAARAVMEAHLAGLLQSKLDLVIFDRTGATDSMIEYCERRGIDFQVVVPTNLEAELLEGQRARRLDSMGLTFNRLIPQSVIESFNGRIFNLHLSLLPMFPGFGATRKALQSGLPYAGVTVHLVDAGIDTGPIIAQRKVPIRASDDEATLGRRQFEAALPLLLQTVRVMENQKKTQFHECDADLTRFAAGYCLTV